MLSGTDVSQKSLDLEKMRLGALGRCRQFFWLGVAFDAVGVAVLFTGVFANLLFYDMLLYLGSIIIFVSLLWWISWYTGNIEALPEDPLRRTSPRVGEVSVHRCGSRRFSLTLRSVSNTFQLIRRRRRQRLLPRVLQRVSNMSSPDPGHMDARTAGGGTSFCLAKPVSVLNQLELCAIQASKSFPLVPLHSPLSISPSRSLPVFSVTSQCHPLASEASESYNRMALSSDCHVPQERSNISLTSRVYPLERTKNQSHLLVPMPPDSFPMVPMISKSQMQGSLSQQSHLQSLPRVSQKQPETAKASESHTLATGVPVVSPGFAQALHPEASLAQTSRVQKVPKNLSAEVFGTLPAPSQKLSREQPYPSSPVSEATHPKHSV
ncbi:uncharacterized protein LOC110556849 isoform X1 [Meriones unguiculatus]|uniref:uncharacterized protein LOC110556849 isoform X1 n=1 Tax=Meriones unguiculatus TaxID=10047 RepID=UPI00293E6879|nr:uncharacterized protein LOC110556849 isoform X1 [Meriones unguiculatus]